MPRRSNQDDRFQFGVAYVDYGWKLAAAKGDFTGALKNCRTGLRHSRSAARPCQARPARLRNLGSAYSKSGDILTQDPRTSGTAWKLYRKALASHTAALALDPTNATYQRGVITDYNDIGDALAACTNDPAAALRSYRSALAGFDALRPDPKDMQVQQDKAFVLGNIGEMLLRTGALEEAARELERALAALKALHDPGSVRMNVRYTVACGRTPAGAGVRRHGRAARPFHSGRIRHWERSRALFQRSQAVFVDLRARGIAVGADAAKADEAGADLARAQAALQRLQAPVTARSASPR